MIEYNDLSVLQTASNIATVASTSEEEALEKSVAYLINMNANTGETRTEIPYALTDTLKAKLASYGYTVEHKKDAYGREIENMYIVS